MSMLNAQRRISKKVFFSEKRLGEKILYNGVEIVALVYIGSSLTRSDWNDTHTQIEHSRLGDLAVFSICDDVSDKNGIKEPIEGDVIIYGDHVYGVSSIIEHDVTGCHWVVLASKEEKAYGR
ncbi:MAG: hypothetical protein QP733_02015 [Dialister micraerophilus]|uniref:Phage protein n=1 Tax=Dialister micraerophilus UPII 345-E TaxID=910314 RepID=E4LA50_9FIRM|nr:hypothetical protein [Dialister micraerophilus]EFR42330.1 hypothetical protein HMPREF9220_0617 [Dialister micraerophilus UPII 345-E]MDK8253216.1 hypothetical protein [Dialister micraerophilus]